MPSRDVPECPSSSLTKISAVDGLLDIPIDDARIPIQTGDVMPTVNDAPGASANGGDGAPAIGAVEGSSAIHEKPIASPAKPRASIRRPWTLPRIGLNRDEASRAIQEMDAVVN